MFVAMSRFVVANGMAEEVREAFRNRPRRVEQAEGFLGMQVLNPEGNPDEFWLVTHWRDRRHYTRWHHSHHYRDSHQGIPRGLKLVRGATEIRCFDVVAE